MFIIPVTAPVFLMVIKGELWGIPEKKDVRTWCGKVKVGEEFGILYVNLCTRRLRVVRI
jgi:hypothetical protein